MNAIGDVKHKKDFGLLPKKNSQFKKQFEWKEHKWPPSHTLDTPELNPA